MSVPEEHKRGAPKSVKFAVITVSTSRYSLMRAGKPFTDESGDLISEMVEKAGHTVSRRMLIPDDAEKIREALGEALECSDIVILSGGTGISPTDVTVETVEPMFEKRLPGFGEIFRLLSYVELGSSAMLTRCTAGTISGRVVFCIPGSPEAVRVALSKLIIPEAGHLVKHARGLG